VNKTPNTFLKKGVLAGGKGKQRRENKKWSRAFGWCVMSTTAGGRGGRGLLLLLFFSPRGAQWMRALQRTTHPARSSSAASDRTPAGNTGGEPGKRTEESKKMWVELSLFFSWVAHGVVRWESTRRLHVRKDLVTNLLF
jgi:hypothetical protein